MDDQKQKMNLINREFLELTGVEDVINFSETNIYITTNLGSLTVIGKELHIQQLDLDESQLIIEGYIIELKYDQELKTKSFFKRIFK